MTASGVAGAETLPPAAAGEPSGALAELSNSVAAATETYHATLRGSLAAAERRGDQAEAERIRGALSGRAVQNFHGEYVRAARRRFDIALQDAARKFTRTVKKNAGAEPDAALSARAARIEAALRAHAPLETVLTTCVDGRLPAADAPDSVKAAGSAAVPAIPPAPGAAATPAAPAVPPAPAAAPASSVPARRAEYYRVQVRAGRGWQKYPLELRAGDRVTLVATGLWTPDVAAFSPANAERFPLAVRAGADAERLARTRTDFVVKAAGGLLMRLDAPEKATAASGVQTVTLAVERAADE